MKSSQIKLALKTAIKAKRPVFLWGAPGVGKSDVVRQIADEIYGDGHIDKRGRYHDDKGKFTDRPYLRDVRAVLLDPVDLRGLPHVNGDNRTLWAIPDFLPREGRGILFLDEVNAAPPLTLAACYQLILDGRLGEYELPDGWIVIAGGNRETDRAVTTRMPSALANRFIHLTFEVDLNDWIAWALQAGIQTELIAFLRFRPNLLHSFDPQKNEKAFPTPRSWEFVSQLEAAGPDKSIEYDLISGTVGEGAAAEFLAFMRIFRTLPNPDSVLMHPEKAVVPDDPATLYALCGALANKAGENNIDRVIQYAGRLPDEFSVLLVRDCVQRTPAVTNSRAFIAWAAKNADVLI
jgi:MoxR-like ATPase